MNRGERAITVIAQDHWIALCRSQNQIEVAVQIHVKRPCAQIRTARNSGWNLAFYSDVLKMLRILLPIDFQARAGCNGKIHFEVVV